MGHTAHVGLTLVAVALVVPFVIRAADPIGPKRVAAQGETGAVIETVSDATLTAKTRRALFNDKRVNASQIDLETIKGQVYLRGKVDSEGAKNAAEDVAAAVDGVKVVKNDLQVVPPSDQAAVDASDRQITATVKSRLSLERDLRGVKVRTDAGTVILTGTAATPVVSARAADLARDVAGVKSVTNDVLVAE